MAARLEGMSVGLAELVSQSSDRHRKTPEIPSVRFEAIHSSCLEFWRSLLHRDDWGACTSPMLLVVIGRILDGRLRTVCRKGRSLRAGLLPAITNAGCVPNTAVFPIARSVR